MDQRRALTAAEKERIYQGKLAGKTLAEVAKEVGCSVSCARKWWRTGRKRGSQGLRTRRGHRGKKDGLSHFRAEVVDEAVTLKQAHHGWGAKRVRVNLQEDARFAGLAIPQRSSLARLFTERCPECVHAHHPREALPAAPQPAQGVHGIWQLDSQEKILLGDGDIASLCDIRDPFGAAMIASQAFSVKRGKGYRKLTTSEVQATLRAGMSEWNTMPDIVQTDHELRLVGGPNDPFPGQLTLWLAGLGIAHHFIRPHMPTDQPHIERNHRTLDGWVLDPEALTDLAHLQQALDAERARYHRAYPSLASDCAGRPPLVAHPELLHQPRPYRPECELALFDIQRVYDFLATFTFRRKPSNCANVSLGRQHYCLGAKRVRDLLLNTVLVRLDPHTVEWVFGTDADPSVEFLRLPLKGINTHSLTGLDLVPVPHPEPIQLSLPLGFSQPGGTTTFGL